MINLIEDALRDIQYRMLLDGVTPDKNEVADVVLKIVEGAGMLPPSVYIERFDVYDNHWEREEKKDS